MKVNLKNNWKKGGGHRVSITADTPDEGAEEEKRAESIKGIINIDFKLESSKEEQTRTGKKKDLSLSNPGLRTI